jgi:tRNA pseudouridine55 synthase
MNGALLVDKPSGPTSHDIVAFVRRALKTRRVGHTGTLDPLATGLLVLLVGHATRCSQFLVTDEKEYLANVRLGQSTETYDAQGLGSDRGQTGVRLGSDPGLTPDRLAAVLAEFRGTFMQTPPPFSAKKVDGVRAYERARKHEPVALAPVEVTVRELEVLSEGRGASFEVRKAPDSDRASDLAPRASDTLLRLRIVCTSGFYVRSLAHDIGQTLGCGAHLEALRRTRVGRFQVADAATLDALEAAGTAAQGRLIPLNTLLADLPAVTLTDEGARRASNGNAVGPGHLAGGVPEPAIPSKVRLLDPSGTLLALAEARADGLLHPLLVLR